MKIGFQNFRRFIDFKPLEYKGITFLVGKNNAGKSTFVKALILINDYLQSNRIDVFNFAKNSFENTNIVTYGRAKNKLAKDNLIKFNYQIENYSIDITISGLNDSTIADVHLFLIKDIKKGIEIKLEPAKSLISISSTKNVTGVIEEQNSDLQELKEKVNTIKKELANFKKNKTSIEYIQKNHELKDLRKKIKWINLRLTFEGIIQNTFSIDAHYEPNKTLSAIFKDFTDSTIFDRNTKFQEIQLGKRSTKEFDNLNAFNDASVTILGSFYEFRKLVTKTLIIYLGSNSTKQSALFPIRDRNNILAQSIHEFYQQKINPGDPVFEFVKKWMKIFEVGDSFKIDFHAGEAYEINVFSNNAEIELADKGTGSIQAMLLILRIASIIQKIKKKDLITTIIVEEPELNLHPALQSKLADLFHEVNKDFKINFIIETHSEYLIRKTQLLVKQNDYEIKPNENPFSVIYFDKDMNQWNMNYREDGKFIEKFGTGFFDVSSNLTFDLI